jgi:hypothetical protein
MSLPEEDYYSKHRYQINIIECAYAVVQKLKSEQIPNHVIAEYAHKLKTGILAYKDSINYDKNASKVARMQACVIKATHPSFDYWLALQLSTEDADEIPMFLDAYVNGEIDSTKDFIGHVQHFVLKIMESIILSNFKEEKRAIIRWIREKRSDNQKLFLIINELKLEINELNVEQKTLIQNRILQVIENNFYNNYYNTKDSRNNENEVNNNNYNFDSDNSVDQEISLIVTQCSFNKAFEHFHQLTNIKNKKNKPYLSDKDIENFLLTNFYFEDKLAIKNTQPIEIRLAQRHLNQLFYDFYYNYDFEDTNDKKEVYFNLLKRTFITQFRTAKFDVWKTNFAKKFQNYPFKSIR